MRVQHPELRITAPTADLGRDAYSRPLFGECDEIVGLFSCEKRWRAKLNRDLQQFSQCPPEEKPTKVFFVTNQRVTDTSKKQIKRDVRDRYQILLEIVALDELDPALRSASLHWVAERELGVRPQQPRVLQPPAAFWDAQQISLPGCDAPLVGRDDELARMRTALAPAADSPTNRVVVVEGPGGVGKTRLVVEAGRASTTLIARTGTALSADKLVDVPLDAPSVIVIDDAHRSPDLSGLAAMVGDPRFAGVTIVLTVRPGLAEPTLRRAGLDHVEPTTIILDPLGRSGISEIVTAHGITDEAFHLHVIDIAEGNPLIAHSACEIAAQQGTYRWQDTTSVLRDLFKNRLSHLTTDGHEHLAVAVALAVLTTAQNSDQLAMLADAVRGLPRDSYRLHELLRDLADAGIVGDRLFTLRPDALGPVIVADALADGRRVKVDLTRTLRVLGRAASWGSGAGEDSDEPGLLGIGLPRSGADSDPAGVHATVLASQLGVLAQAAYLTGRHAGHPADQLASRPVIETGIAGSSQITVQPRRFVGVGVTHRSARVEAALRRVTMCHVAGIVSGLRTLREQWNDTAPWYRGSRNVGDPGSSPGPTGGRCSSTGRAPVFLAAGSASGWPRCLYRASCWCSAASSRSASVTVAGP